MGSCLSCLDYEAEEIPGWAVLRNYQVDDITGASRVFIYLLYMDASEFRLLELHNAKLPPDHSTALTAPSSLWSNCDSSFAGKSVPGKARLHLQNARWAQTQPPPQSQSEISLKFYLSLLLSLSLTRPCFTPKENFWCRRKCAVYQVENQFL